MKNTIKSRKGVTLTELVVVLAVVVIAAGMVVTFSSMMHGAQGISNERYEALQDVRTAEALIEGFILNNTREGYYVKWKNTADGNNTMPELYFYNAMNGSTPFDEGSRFIKMYPNGMLGMSGVDTSVLTFEHIKSIAFEVKCEVVEDPKPNPTIFSDIEAGVCYSHYTHDALYYCTITYEVADTPYTYTFCVNPYVGEGVN